MNKNIAQLSNLISHKTNMKKILPIIIALILTSGGVFYGGMKYGQSKSLLANLTPQGFQNLSLEQRQQKIQQTGTAGINPDSTMGTIILKDDQSVTIKLKDGGSKIIFYSDDTKISQSIKGTLNDLTIGQDITVQGKANSDGSLTAQSIQLPSEINHP